MWEIEMKRWWRKTWAPFTLVLVAQSFFGYSDMTEAILALFL